MKEYVLLSSLYYNHKDEYEKLYQTRIQSEESVHLNFKIGEYPAFYMETPELIRKVVEITRLDKEIALLSKQLPGIALRQYINKCLIDEIVITNNIEGVYPESEIIRKMNEAMDILNDDKLELLFRIPIFHYLFGYIHPFYNGNGRLNRFISSYYLSRILEPVLGYRLSYTIKENVNRISSIN